jgi:GNAT superfamily N-acetyltransferase
MSSYSIRRATVDDAAMIAWHRAAMFREMGELSPSLVPAFEAATTGWIAERMAREEYLGWFVEYEQRVVSGGGVLLRDLWPTPDNCRASRSAHVGSMYTEEDHRKRGLGRCIMQAILDWCAANDIELVTLHASPAGRHLYEQLGFTSDSRAMRLFLTPSPQR